MLLRFIIALVWLINGLFCKVLNMVPRHTEIVSRILGEEHARSITITIGVLETLMCAWILTGIKAKQCAIVQMLLILVMNIIEFIKVPDLLLFGKLNIIFTFIFILIIYYQYFFLHQQKKVVS